MAFMVYVTDGLKAANDNLAAIARGGVVLSERYFDLVTKKQIKDTRTAEEIAEDIIKKAGLTFEEGR